MTRHPQWISLDDVELLQDGDETHVVSRHQEETPDDLIPLLVVLGLLVTACLLAAWVKGWFD